MIAEDLRRRMIAAGVPAYEAGMHHETVQAALQAAKGALEGRFLAEGLWLNHQAVEYGAQVEALLLCPELLYSEEWIERCVAMATHCGSAALVSAKVYERLSADKSDRGALGIVQVPRYTLDDIQEGKKSLLLVLDGLENPGNVGTLIRTADGAGADAVLLCNRKTGLTNASVVRSSLCTLLTKPIVEVEVSEALAWLAQRGFTVYLGKAEARQRYCDIGYSRRSAVVVGNEKYGVTDAFFAAPHVGVSIPMQGRVDSLNVAVAGSILLYEAARSLDFGADIGEERP